MKPARKPSNQPQKATPRATVGRAAPVSRFPRTITDTRILMPNDEPEVAQEDSLALLLRDLERELTYTAASLDRVEGLLYNGGSDGDQSSPKDIPFLRKLRGYCNDLEAIRYQAQRIEEAVAGPDHGEPRG